MRLKVLLLLVVALSLMAACEAESPVPAFVATPPCTPVVGSGVDPCESGAELVRNTNALIPWSDAPISVRDLLEGSTVHAGHLVVRATYVPNTIRCIADGMAYRAQSWRDFNEEDIMPYTAAVKCYADVRANEYLVGAGPNALTVQIDHYWYPRHEHADISEKLRVALEAAFVSGTENPYIDVRSGGIGGREAILSIGPALDVSSEARRAYTTWDVQQREGVGPVAIHPHWSTWVRSDKYQAVRNIVEMPIATFKREVQAAHNARMSAYSGRIGRETDLPMVRANANQLRTYVADVGGYEHDDGPPMQPPPACGLSVQDHTNNPGLVVDCGALLAVKDTLRGEGALNWELGTTITAWDGVKISGAPKRVTGLSLGKKGLTGTFPANINGVTALRELHLHQNALTGSIPEDVGELAGLHTLTLNGNKLTGTIPASLGGLASLVDLWLHKNDLSGPIPLAFGDLANLRSILLAGNNLTGCIPRELYIVETNDMHLIDLPTCL